MKSIEEDGVWFLPNNPENKVYGRLTFSTDEPPKLYLIGQLQEVQFGDRIPHTLDFDIINGDLVNNKKVTLCHCYQPIGFKTGIQTSKVYAKYLLVGHHFKTLEEILLKGVVLRYKNLEEWVDLPNFDINWSTNEEKNQVKEINVKQKTLEPIELGNLLGFLITLHDKPVNLQSLEIASLFGTIGRKISLEERKSIIIRAHDDEKSLDDIIKVIYLFQDLLVFASGQMTYPYDIQSSILVMEKEIKIPDHLSFDLMTGRIKPERVTKSDLGFEIRTFGEEIKAVEEEKEKLVPIEIYFQLGELHHLDAKFDAQRVLFSFKDVKEKFNELLSLWESNSNNLEAIIDLYLRLTYIPRRHINDFFLSLAQAMEAFHSLAHDGKHLDKKVYKSVIRKRLEEAVASIPDTTVSENGEETDLREYKRILKEEKLAHLNSYSLRERLEELISEYSTCLPNNFFTSAEEKYDFLKKIRKTRNYLTHLSSREDNDVVSGQDLIVLCRKLKKLLEVCLLKQLGLEELTIKTIISKNR